MEDNELFELCKQVYEVTKWGRMDNLTPTDDYFLYKVVVPWERFGASGILHSSLSSGRAVPLYTSDYLLEKLPRYLDGHNIEMFYEEDEGSAPWCFGYHHDSKRLMLSAEPLEFAQGYGYTPLQALLRLTLTLTLTLALHKEGLLK